MTDFQAARALWLALGDPFRMGWLGVGAFAVLLAPHLLPYVPSVDAALSGNGTLLWAGGFLAYWVFMAPAIRRTLDPERRPIGDWKRWFWIIVAACALLAADRVIFFLFDRFAWPSGFAGTGAAYHLLIIFVAFVKDAGMVLATRDGAPSAPLKAPLLIFHGPKIAVGYALLFFIAFLLNPTGGPWIGFLAMPLLLATDTYDLAVFLSQIGALYLVPSMTALLGRGVLLYELGARRGL